MVEDGQLLVLAANAICCDRSAPGEKCEDALTAVLHTGLVDGPCTAR
jgi:hypothetical protein